ncbi:MAG: hypothetical protein R3F61_29420 [Myxococcota bacterium]
MFDHRAHLAVAFESLDQHGLAGAMARVPERLRTLAEVAGEPGKYHETLTIAWLLVLADRRGRCPGASLDTVLERFPELLDPGCVARLYAEGTLASAEARAAFRLPDRWVR